MDPDLESSKMDRGTPYVVCNPSTDRETGSKGRIVAIAIVRRVNGMYVLKARCCPSRTADPLVSLTAIHRARSATVHATWMNELYVVAL